MKHLCKNILSITTCERRHLKTQRKAETWSAVHLALNIPSAIAVAHSRAHSVPYAAPARFAWIVRTLLVVVWGRKLCGDIARQREVLQSRAASRGHVSKGKNFAQIGRAHV